MKIKSSSIPIELLNAINNPDPLEGEDILIENEDGSLLAVIIQPRHMNFFFKKLKKEKMNWMQS